MTQRAQLLPLKHTHVFPQVPLLRIDNLWFEEENPRALSTVVELGEIYSGVLGTLSVEPQSPTPHPPPRLDIPVLLFTSRWAVESEDLKRNFKV